MTSWGVSESYSSSGVHITSAAIRLGVRAVRCPRPGEVSLTRHEVLYGVLAIRRTEKLAWHG